ncbi:hypothetical protein ECEC1868_2473 [Escherichia coli EC1868]|nr:hypothetical protein ECEC1868_2473 [Escherichia coli EC1868]
MTLKEFIKSLRVGDAKKFAARLGVNRHLTYRKWRLDEQLYLQPAPL